ncbi:lipoate--protein ligase family protein [Carboxylicivirga sp. N1Y90]|uniref:lipoate--protein ligase family protein n=1 Tax=Carboxylicivirga fragile TaxID=3417571 RepID=UPI003D33F9DC|nr:lipoate--protein ligase [Marinilabiliaceae bacterium N1Y90]
MIGIRSKNTNAAYNLATEEYLLRHTSDDLFFLYVNQPSIIVGKHQNALAEINIDYTSENKISVHRRLSGGGTVYHDLNNLNFCFIKSGKKTQLVNFAEYSKPIISALKNLGIEAHFGKRHDIQINHKKISGNASHVFKNRVMHHGTLLFDSDLDVLNNALKTNPLQFKDKAVKSVRSEVCNIQPYTNNLDFKSFSNYIFEYLLNYFPGSKESHISAEANTLINSLVKEKYNTWNWNFGYSPDYLFKKRIKLEDGTRCYNETKITKGVITECHLKNTNSINQELLDQISKSIIGLEFDVNKLNIFFSELIYANISKSDLLTLFRP